MVALGSAVTVENNAPSIALGFCFPAAAYSSVAKVQARIVSDKRDK
jgi:hypothetical protein